MIYDIEVKARSEYINSALIITFFHILFLPINIIIFSFTIFSKRLRSLPEVFNIILFNTITTFISRNLYALFTYFWWFSYFTDKAISIHLTNIVEHLRYIGMNMIFLTPFILSFWRYMMIAHRKYISMIFCTVIYIVLLLPNGIELYDSSLVSKNLIDGDIFSQTYTFSYKFIFFVFVWPQIISPFVTFFFIFEIIRKVRNRCGQSITLSSTDKMTKNVTISLIICSIPPIVASLLTFLLHFLFFFKIAHVSRSLWNISEILLSFIGGSNPIFLVCFMKPFRLAILDFVNPNMVHHLQTKKTCNKINGFTTIKKIVVVDKNECEKLEG